MLLDLTGILIGLLLSMVAGTWLLACDDRKGLLGGESSDLRELVSSLSWRDSSEESDLLCLVID